MMSFLIIANSFKSEIELKSKLYSLIVEKHYQEIN